MPATITSRYAPLARAGSPFRRDYCPAVPVQAAAFPAILQVPSVWRSGSMLRRPLQAPCWSSASGSSAHSTSERY